LRPALGKALVPARLPRTGLAGDRAPVPALAATISQGRPARRVRRPSSQLATRGPRLAAPPAGRNVDSTSGAEMSPRRAISFCCWSSDTAAAALIRASVGCPDGSSPVAAVLVLLSSLRRSIRALARRCTMDGGWRSGSTNSLVMSLVSASEIGERPNAPWRTVVYFVSGPGRSAGPDHADSTADPDR